MTEPLTISVPEAAKRLGIGRTLMWRLVSDGQIKAVRVGGRTLVPVAELVRYVEKEAA